MNAAPPISPAKYGNFHTFPIPIAHPAETRIKPIRDPNFSLFILSSFHGGRKLFALVYVPICISRSEEHTSELQSRFDLVCRLLLEKKNKITCDMQIVKMCRRILPSSYAL